MIKIKVSGSTAGEVFALLQGMVHGMGHKVCAEVKVDRDALKENAVVSQAEPLPTNDKPAKEAKAKKEKPVVAAPVLEELPTEVEVVEPEKVEAGPKYTKQDISAKTQEVSTELSLDKAREIIGRFETAGLESCRRVSDIQEADYFNYITACNNALAEKKA